jgi:hypothetical protein
MLAGFFTLPPSAAMQGLTLVHFSAQRMHFLWDTLVGVSLSVTNTAQVELESEGV